MRTGRAPTSCREVDEEISLDGVASRPCVSGTAVVLSGSTPSARGDSGGSAGDPFFDRFPFLLADLPPCTC